MLISIYDLRTTDIQAKVRTAVGGRPDTQALQAFVASVDWSRRDGETPPQVVVDMLGKIEAWTTELAEGDLSEREYTGRLLSMLPESERLAPLASITP